MVCCLYQQLNSTLNLNGRGTCGHVRTCTQEWDTSEAVKEAAHVLLALHCEVKAVQEGQVGKKELVSFWIQPHLRNVLCCQDTVP